VSDASQIIAVNIPANAGPGQQFSGTITIKNVGDTTWTTGGNDPYLLGAQDPQDTDRWGGDRRPLPHDVAPGDTVVVTLSLTAPVAEDTYPCSWKLLHEHVAWFGPIASSPVVVVGAPPDPPAPVISAVELPPAPTTDPDALVSAVVAGSGRVVMDGLQRVVRWVNTTGRTLRIKKAYVWSGVDANCVADVHTQLTRGSDGAPLVFVQWDRYAEPTAPNNSRTEDFDPYMLLEPGDWLDMLYSGKVYIGGTKHEEHRATIWVQYAPGAE
jgi:hypothetical protein